MYCYSCGREINDLANYCKYCGVRVASAAVQPSGQIQPSASIQPTQEMANGYSASPNQPDYAYYGTAPQATAASSAAYYQPPSAAQPTTPQATTGASPALYQASSAAQSSVFPSASGTVSPGATPRSKDSADPLSNIIFGVGHIVLIVLTFLPWVKAALNSYNPYMFAQQLIENGVAGERPDAIFIGVLTALILLVIVAYSGIGIFMRFARKQPFNIGNIVVLAACIFFLVVPFLMPKGGSGNYEFQINISFEIGFYLEIVAAAILSVLGSRKFDIQKLLKRGNANG